MANNQNNNRGNFANDPERASREGQKGGQKSGGNAQNLNRGRNGGYSQNAAHVKE